MWLEDFIPSENSDKLNQWSEVSEKFKESIKKAWAWIKRVQKDEKKAKKFDNILASFLVKIIKNEKYDFLLDDLFKSLDNWFSSNFLLGILSLIYLPVSDKIREISKKEIINFNYKKSFSIIEFNDDLDEEIKTRINLWVEDMIDIITIEYSSLQMKKMIELSKKDEFNFIINFSSKVFRFFFSEININISEKKSHDYVNFILDQVMSKIKKIELEEI